MNNDYSPIIKNLNQIPKGIKFPSTDKLKKVVNNTIEESSILRRKAKFDRKDEKLASFISVGLLDLEYILSFFTANKPIFFQELAITRRKFLEVYIDLNWVYSFYKKSPNLAEDLAKRFFQVSSNKFFELQSTIKHDPNSPFFTSSILNQIHSEEINKSRATNLIELCPSFIPKNKVNDLKKHWRIHPNFINDNRLMKQAKYFEDRIKAVEKFVQQEYLIKNPSFIKDYKRLNYFTHWSTFSVRELPEIGREDLYRIEINSMLGYLHDILNLITDYLNIEPSDKISSLRMEFFWLK